MQQIRAKQTVADVLNTVGPKARFRLGKYFSKAGIDYPPAQATLLAVKNTSSVELWAGSQHAPVFIRRYQIMAASGVTGPKLREGDKQVPEGLYSVVSLNPISSFHLSMKLDYPNLFDLANVHAEGRSDPGGDIFIHGKAKSAGCLAMGDVAIEELFVLAADIEVENLSVVIAPADPRHARLAAAKEPVWLQRLYQNITAEFTHYRR